MISDIKKNITLNDIQFLFETDIYSTKIEENKYEFFLEPKQFYNYCEYFNEKTKHFEENFSWKLIYLQDLNLFKFQSHWLRENIEYSDAKIREGPVGYTWGNFVNLYRIKWWKYTFFYNKEKIKLFKRIVFENKEYPYTLELIKYIVNFCSNNVDLESFIDFMEMDSEDYIFYDIELIVYAIASYNKYYFAKVLHYILSKMDDKTEQQFNKIIELDWNFSLDKSDERYSHNFRKVYFSEKERIKIVSHTERISLPRKNPYKDLLLISDKDSITLGALENKLCEYFLEKKKERSLCDKTDVVIHVYWEIARDWKYDKSFDSLIKEVNRKARYIGLTNLFSQKSWKIRNHSFSA